LLFVSEILPEYLSGPNFGRETEGDQQSGGEMMWLVKLESVG